MTVRDKKIVLTQLKSTKLKWLKIKQKEDLC